MGRSCASCACGISASLHVTRFIKDTEQGAGDVDVDVAFYIHIGGAATGEAGEQRFLGVASTSACIKAAVYAAKAAYVAAALQGIFLGTRATQTHATANANIGVVTVAAVLHRLQIEVALNVYVQGLVGVHIGTANVGVATGA